MIYDVMVDGALPGYTLTIDGEVTRHVYAFDTEAGIICRYCTDTDHNALCKKHIDPATSEPCTTVERGRVRLLNPDGVDVTDEPLGSLTQRRLTFPADTRRTTLVDG